jgi:hypothetical protein
LPFNKFSGQSDVILLKGMAKIYGAILMGALVTLVAFSNKPDTGSLATTLAIVGVSTAYDGYLDICNADYGNCPNCGCANRP